MALYETIPYKVIKKDGNIELREYDVVLLASTKSTPNNRQDSGFQNVFNYISGQNQTSEKISMTTPVVTYQEENQMVTGFYVPSKYDKSSAPKPSSSSVFINEFNASLYAVIRFRGAWTNANYQKNDTALLDYIKSNNLKITSPRLIFRYTPPFVPGVLKRNEIAYQVQNTT